MGIDLGEISARVGLNIAPLKAGAAQAKGIMTALDKTLTTGGLKQTEAVLANTANGFKAVGESAVPTIGIFKNADKSAKGLGAQLKAMSGLGGEAAGKLSAVGSSLGTLGTIGVAAATVAATGIALFSCARAAEEVNKVTAQTVAVIKSTGGVANVSKEHVENLGSQLRDLSGVDDEVVKSGENLLLTFRQIRNEVGKGNDIFDQATRASLDMSVAMKKDLRDSVLKVGKALNDPIKGLTALRRYGVMFTDSQEKMIRKLMEAGDMLGAQKVIIAELNAEFGGSAAALGNTLTGKIDILKSKFGDLKEALGGPFIATFTTQLQGLGLVFKGLSAIKLPEILSWGTRIGGDIANPIMGAIDATKTLYNLLESPAKKIKVDIDSTNVIDKVREMEGSWSWLKGGRKVTKIEVDAKDVDAVTAKLKGAGMDRVKVVADTSSAQKNVNDLDAGYVRLKRDAKAAIDEIKGTSTALTDALDVKGLSGITGDMMDGIITGLTDGSPMVQDAATDLFGQILEAEGRANPQIKAAASGMMEQISTQVAAVPAGERTASKMQEIINGVMAAGPPVSQEMQNVMTLLAQIVASQPVTPKINPPVTSGWDPDSWLGSFNSRLQAILDANPSTPKINAPQQLGPPAPSSGDSGGSMSGGGMLGAGSADTIAQGYQTIANAFGGLKAEMDSKPFAEVEAAIIGMTAGNFAALADWRNIRAAYDNATASLGAYEKKMQSAEKAIESTEKAIEKTSDRISKLNERLDQLSEMRFKGQTAADDKSFAQEQKLNGLKLAIMKAEDKHNYEQAALLQLQADDLERAKEEADLLTQITFDPLERAREKLLNPVKEGSASAINAQIKATQREIAVREKQLANQEASLARQEVSLKKMEVTFDGMQESVEKFKTVVDDLSEYFKAKWSEANPAGFAEGGPVAQTGFALVHQGELVLTQADQHNLMKMIRAKDYAPVQTAPSSTYHTTILELDGKVIAKSVSRFQGNRAQALSMSGGRF
jgi:hypothetical protein